MESGVGDRTVEMLPVQTERAVNRLRDRENGWCILRTNGRRTLRLVQSLCESGIEAWTPKATHKRRLSRVHMGFREVEQPIVPSFVFARSRHLPDLLQVMSLPSSPHPPFSIFQYAGRAPVISDRDISNLQDAEEKGKRARRRAQRPLVAVGAHIRPTRGAFAGLVGVVEEAGTTTALVCFNDHFRVKVATWLLVDDDVESPPSPT